MTEVSIVYLCTLQGLPPVLHLLTYTWRDCLTLLRQRSIHKLCLMNVLVAAFAFPDADFGR